jgi:hypothetical protein
MTGLKPHIKIGGVYKVPQDWWGSYDPKLKFGASCIKQGTVVTLVSLTSKHVNDENGFMHDYVLLTDNRMVYFFEIRSKPLNTLLAV